MKQFTSLFCAILAATAAQAVELPVVTDVTLSQDSSTRVVTVNYTLSGTNAIITFDALTNGVSIGGENIHYVVGDVNKLVQPGQRALYWQARRSWPDQKVQNAFQVRGTAHLSLAADGPRRIEALNADGEPVGEVESTYEDGRVRFLADTARFPGGVVGYRVQRKE